MRYMSNAPALINLQRAMGQAYRDLDRAGALGRDPATAVAARALCVPASMVTQAQRALARRVVVGEALATRKRAS